MKRKMPGLCESGLGGWGTEVVVLPFGKSDAALTVLGIVIGFESVRFIVHVCVKWIQIGHTISVQVKAFTGAIFVLDRTDSDVFDSHWNTACGGVVCWHRIACGNTEANTNVSIFAVRIFTCVKQQILAWTYYDFVVLFFFFGCNCLFDIHSNIPFLKELLCIRKRLYFGSLLNQCFNYIILTQFCQYIIKLMPV